CSRDPGAGGTFGYYFDYW
nr:immunoglobulin heavy chain junction region [Macaca mulatta]MOW46278.1 immunoglobulin heavy chain junction region [Macaca mulatta]MOW46600.1 immunoglobulin heavy chain junction region [Macaca mulatta]MOW46705.1 immunoglobulin heavy chain junction region [Macaca mulatta]MOW47457.1 immunoglobulin heavy chain junction region [Macaca mulatta]